MAYKRIEAKYVSIPTVSLGDIAFLLIIFFLLTSNFYKESPLKLKPPRAADLKNLQEFPVSVSIDQSGRIFLQGKQVPDAEAVEWGVAALTKGKASAEGRTVMFKCDDAIPRDVFEPVLDAISRGDGIIAAMGQKVKETQ
jgi:biopolymer transport protein ExbD